MTKRFIARILNNRTIHLKTKQEQNNQKVKCVTIYTFMGGGVVAQESMAPPYVELFFVTKNLPSLLIMSLTLQNQSQCWGKQ